MVSDAHPSFAEATRLWLAFVALFVFRIPFPLVILAAALVGLAMVLRTRGGTPAQIADEKVLLQSAGVPRPLRTILIGGIL